MLSQPLSITLPPLRITLNEEQQVNLEWLTQQLNQLIATTSEETLPPEMRRWILVNKLQNQPDEQLIKTLVEKGFDSSLVTQELQSLTTHPSFQVCRNYLQLLQKLESHYKISRELESLSAKYGKIDRKSSISREYFLENYYSKNQPVIITNVMHNWQALQRWNPHYLKEHYGQAMVQIQSNRDAYTDYEINIEKHREEVRFADYIDRILTGGATNNYYMVANNQTLARPEFVSLLDDIEIFPEYLNPQETQGRIFFWFGPQGTITPLHHDPVNVLLTQVYGRKLVKLIPPNCTPLMYNYIGVFSEVILDTPDYEKYPLFKEIKTIDVLLEPGEAIFLPVGWWHYVRSLDISISVSFTNFVFPNYYEWKYPHVQW